MLLRSDIGVSGRTDYIALYNKYNTLATTHSINDIAHPVVFSKEKIFDNQLTDRYDQFISGHTKSYSPYLLIISDNLGPLLLDEPLFFIELSRQMVYRV